MINSAVNKCIVCGYDELTSEQEFCPGCNLEILLIPANSSGELKRYWKERIEKHKEIIDQRNDLSEQLSKKEDEVAGMYSHISKLEADNNALNTDWRNRETELNEKVKFFKAEIRNMEKEIADLKTQVGVIKHENDELQKQIQNNINNDGSINDIKNLKEENARLKKKLTPKSPL